MDYHSISTPVLEAVAAALVPRAAANSASSGREAVWLGAGLIAVSGFSSQTLGLDGEAAGVMILDTEDWTSCRLDRRPTHVAVWGGDSPCLGRSQLRRTGRRRAGRIRPDKRSAMAPLRAAVSRRPGAWPLRVRVQQLGRLACFYSRRLDRTRAR